MTSIPIDFPYPATHNQIYPDLEGGDAGLDNGKIYQYDGVKEVWDVICDSEDGEDTGPGGSEDYLGRYGDTVGTSDNVTYHWRTQGLIFSSDLEVKFNLDNQLGLKIDKEQVYSELPFTVNEDFTVLGSGDVLLGPDSVNAFMATADHHAVSKKYLDSIGYVKKTGDVMTGSLTFDGGLTSSAIIFDPEENQIQEIRVKNNSSGSGQAGGLAISLQGNSNYNTFNIYGGSNSSEEFLNVSGRQGIFTFSTPVIINANNNPDPAYLEVKGTGGKIKATNNATVDTGILESSDADLKINVQNDLKISVNGDRTYLHQKSLIP